MQFRHLVQWLAVHEVRLRPERTVVRTVLLSATMLTCSPSEPDNVLQSK